MLTALEEEIDSNTIIVGDFNTSLTPMDRKSRQKINKETQALNDTTVQMDFIDIYRTFHPKTADTLSFKCPGTLARIDHILGHKPSISNFKKIEIISNIFSKHNTMRLEINHREKKEKKHRYMEAKNYITK